MVWIGRRGWGGRELVNGVILVIVTKCDQTNLEKKMNFTWVDETYWLYWSMILYFCYSLPYSLTTILSIFVYLSLSFSTDTPSTSSFPSSPFFCIILYPRPSFYPTLAPSVLWYSVFYSFFSSTHLILSTFLQSPNLSILPSVFFLLLLLLLLLITNLLSKIFSTNSLLSILSPLYLSACTPE